MSSIQRALESDTFKCPLTGDVFSDPYIVNCCGQSFDKSALEKHLENHDGKCPRCENYTSGFPNVTLKQSIDELKQKILNKLNSTHETILIRDIPDPSETTETE